MEISKEPLDPLRLLLEMTESIDLDAEKSDLIRLRVSEATFEPTTQAAVALALLAALREAGVLKGYDPQPYRAGDEEYEAAIAARDAMEGL